MDFFGQQEATRRNTVQLVAYFLLAMVLIVLAVYAAVVLIFVVGGEDGGHGSELPAALWNPPLFAVCAVATLTLIVAGSVYKISSLRRGGPAVAEALGGRLVNPASRDRDERRLLNVVEEMAIASGTPVPAVYLLRGEGAINAFAAGHGGDDAVVAVTRGALRRLSRDELQGVVAHEFSHILNGDMRLNIRLMGLLHGILLIGLIGKTMLRAMLRRGNVRSSSNRSKGGGVMVFALALLVIGYIGLFFGQLIKAAVSRQREFLADAAAVQFTRQPGGIAGALKKIGGMESGGQLQAANAETASHLYFADGLSRRLIGALATHPPLEKRIQRLEPDWDGRFAGAPAEVPPEVSPQAGAADPERLAEVPPRAGPWSAASTPATAPETLALSPQAVVAQAGQPTPAHLAHAQALLGALPPRLLDSAHEPHGARALVYALLLSGDAAARQRQLDHLQAEADPGVMEELEKIRPELEALPPDARMPLLNLCLPALRGLSERQRQAFRANLDALVAADATTSPFELAVRRVARRHLGPEPAKAPGAPGNLARDSELLLAGLARVGHRDREAAAAAFTAGLAELRRPGSPAMPPGDQTDAPAVGAAIDRLAGATPLQKRALVAACAAAIAHDGRVTVEEAELLRAVTDSLEVPMPPFLGDVAQAEDTA